MRIKQLLTVCVTAAAAMLLLNFPAQAHHAFAAEFDATKPIRVEGTISKVQWTNPHSWFFVDVMGADGQLEHWMFEGGGPLALIRRGFTKDYLKPGTKIVVEGFLAKGVAYRANARSLTYPDGRVLFVGSSGTGAPSDGKDPSEK
jgi:Family of unknown function (DUF6152)